MEVFSVAFNISQYFYLETIGYLYHLFIIFIRIFKSLIQIFNEFLMHPGVFDLLVFADIMTQVEESVSSTKENLKIMEGRIDVLSKELMQVSRDVKLILNLLRAPPALKCELTRCPQNSSDCKSTITDKYTQETSDVYKARTRLKNIRSQSFDAASCQRCNHSVQQQQQQSTQPSQLPHMSSKLQSKDKFRKLSLVSDDLSQVSNQQHVILMPLTTDL